MPGYVIEGQAFFVSGFHMRINADSEELARKEARRIAEAADVERYGLGLHEVCIEVVHAVPPITPVDPHVEVLPEQHIVRPKCEFFDCACAPGCKTARQCVHKGEME